VERPTAAGEEGSGGVADAEVFDGEVKEEGRKTDGVGPDGLAQHPGEGGFQFGLETSFNARDAHPPPEGEEGKAEEGDKRAPISPSHE